MTDTPQDAERLAEIRATVGLAVAGGGWTGGDSPFLLRLLDARDARIAILDATITDMGIAYDNVAADLAQAEAALRKYGHHFPDCIAYGPCVCGYAEALREAAAPASPERA